MTSGEKIFSAIVRKDGEGSRIDISGPGDFEDFSVKIEPECPIKTMSEFSRCVMDICEGRSYESSGLIRDLLGYCGALYIQKAFVEPAIKSRDVSKEIMTKLFNGGGKNE